MDLSLTPGDPVIPAFAGIHAANNVKIPANSKPIHR